MADIKIMVVDDQKAMRALIRSTLSELNHKQVVECCDGAEALARLGEQPVDLVISDLNMPKLDGLGLLRAVRAQENLKKLPFIMLTSRSEVALVKEAIALGVNNYIVKPFNVITMKQKIAAVMGPFG